MMSPATLLSGCHVDHAEPIFLSRRLNIEPRKGCPCYDRGRLSRGRWLLFFVFWHSLSWELRFNAGCS